MKKILFKHELLISISLIIIYIILNSFCLNEFGLTNYKSFICNLVLTLIIVIFIIKNKLCSYYGLTKFKINKEVLYFIPLVLIISTNLWGGININNSLNEIINFILCMMLIGFLEEIIFRGFLFKAIAKDSVNQAIVISSITFGIGHIINLFNGAPLVPTLFQIGYAISIGFLFVTIFQKTKSLWPCIITHSLVNSLSIFQVENNSLLYIVSIFLIIVPIIYTIYLRKKTLD